MASLTPYPKVRDEVVIRRIDACAEPYVVAKEPGPPPKYFDFEVWEEDLLRLIDGTRSFEEIAEDFARIHPGTDVDAQYVADFTEALKSGNILERTEQEQHLAMLDKAKTLRKKRFYDAEKSKLLQIVIPLFDPNNLMDRTIHWIRWWWSPWFVAPWLAVFTVVLGYLVYRWDVYWAGFFSLLDPTRKGFLDWVAVIGIMFLTGMWHELGHGYTCKRFGGEVHNIGIMIFYLEPAFYCLTDDAYIFKKRSHRMWVSFGGAYFELMACSVAVAVWVLTPPEWLIHELAIIEVLFSGLSLVLFNGNPLIKLDGYYALMDFLEIPELREQSFAYMGNLAKKHILRMPITEQAISRRRRRAYLIYGLAAIAYTTSLLVFIYLFLEKYMVQWFGPVGYLLLLGLLAYFLRQKIRDGVRFMKHFWLDKRDWIRTPVGSAVTVGVVLGLLLLLTVPRSPTRIEGRFVVEPGRQTVIRMPVAGIVRKVLVTEGQKVEAGDLVAVAESPDLEARHDIEMASLKRLQREAARDRRAGDTAGEIQKMREGDETRSRTELIEQKLGSMEIRAARSGVVATPHVEEMEGRVLGQGDELFAVDSIRTVLLAVAAPELDIEEIVPGIGVRILAETYPGRPIRETVLSVSPVALAPTDVAGGLPDIVRRSNLVRVLIEVDNTGGLFRPGMSGRAQFETRRRSVAGKAWWVLHRWGASIVW